MDLSEVERFRRQKIGDSAEEAETISGTGGLSPEEMKVIRAMRKAVPEAKLSQEPQSHEVTADKMTSDKTESSECEIVSRIHAAQNSDELMNIVQEMYPEMPGFEKACDALEDMGYRLLWTKKGRYVPLK